MRSILVTALILLASGAAGSQPADDSTPTVTLDVKDADIRAILLSMKEQCGIKNMLIEDDVTGTGPFIFREVPCETALKVVFRTQSLDWEIQENSVVLIRKKKG